MAASLQLSFPSNLSFVLSDKCSKQAVKRFFHVICDISDKSSDPLIVFTLTHQIYFLKPSDLSTDPLNASCDSRVISLRRIL